jgi:hypothetical protein
VQSCACAAVNAAKIRGAIESGIRERVLFSDEQRHLV